MNEHGLSSTIQCIKMAEKVAFNIASEGTKIEDVEECDKVRLRDSLLNLLHSG